MGTGVSSGQPCALGGVGTCVSVFERGHRLRRAMTWPGSCSLQVWAFSKHPHCFTAPGVWAPGRGLPDSRAAGERVHHPWAVPLQGPVTEGYRLILVPTEDRILTTSPGHPRTLSAIDYYYFSSANNDPTVLDKQSYGADWRGP